jgi:hypothetical protein
MNTCAIAYKRYELGNTLDNFPTIFAYKHPATLHTYSTPDIINSQMNAVVRSYHNLEASRVSPLTPSPRAPSPSSLFQPGHRHNIITIYDRPPNSTTNDHPQHPKDIRGTYNPQAHCADIVHIPPQNKHIHRVADNERDASRPCAVGCLEVQFVAAPGLVEDVGSAAEQERCGQRGGEYYVGD